VLVAAVAIFLVRPLWATPSPSRGIVVLDPPAASPLARLCVTRLRQELTADGFDVSTLDPGPQRDPVSLAAVMEREADATAVLAIVGEPGEPRTELWILDRVGTKPVTRRLAVPTDDPERTAEVLAIRALEVLKASALKRLIDAAPPASAPPAPAAPSIALPIVAPSIAAPSIVAPSIGASPLAASPLTSPRVGLEAGVSVLGNVDGPGPAAIPLVRTRVRLAPFLFARLTLAGLGSEARVDARTGSALVSQSFALVELAAALRPGRRLRPGLSLGVGTLRDEIRGEGIWPYQGREDAQWALALDAGLGLLLQVSHGVSFALEGHALVAVPHATVRFDKLEAARLGFPAVLGSLSMVAWL